MTLTPSQAKHLRSVGRALAAAVVVGKAGLSDAVAGQVRRALAARELIKVRLPAGPPTERKELAERLAAAAEADLAGVIGRTCLLYRRNDELAPSARVPLP